MTLYLRYVAKRLLSFAAVVLASLVINFLVPRLAPGNPIEAVVARLRDLGAMVGEEELVREYERMFGLEGDWLTQFLNYLCNVARGNLGYSIPHFPATVSGMIMRALPWTIGLLSTTVVLSWTIGTVLGALSGWRGTRSRLGEAFALAALGLYTIPYYVLAIILVYFLAYLLGLFPISGAYSPGVQPGLNLEFIRDVIWHSMLPALSIVLASLGWWYLSMRSMITTIKGEDFILMAEAKGLPESMVLWSYAFRNALLPQVTGLALSIGRIVGGALLTEVVFSYPGIGWLLYAAIMAADYPVIQGITLLVTLSVCTATFILDLIYPLIDPRVKHGGG